MRRTAAWPRAAALLGVCIGVLPRSFKMVGLLFLQRGGRMLSATKLGAALDDDRLAELQAAGDVLDLQPTERLFAEGEPGSELHVVVEGDLTVEGRGRGRPAWIGPGDILGEIGFVLGTPRTASARAGPDGCRVWRLHRSVFTASPSPERLALMARLFTGLAPFVRVRLAKVVEEQAAPVLGPLRDHCDHAHPAVQRMAWFLGQAGERETARSIWEFVRHIPYRIGFWNLQASRVLQLGFGMCTTKSSLQVALMRARGIESAFAEVVCASDAMNAIVPSGYHHFLNRKPRLKHFFAVARLDGRWLPLDATFPPRVWRVLHPEHADALGPGDPFNPVNDMLRRDPFQFEVHQDLSHVMSKRPFFDADSVEAMNIVLDKLQGRPLPPPGWVSHIDRLLADDPRAAFQHAFAGLSAELVRLREVLSGTWHAPPPAGAPGEAVL